MPIPLFIAILVVFEVLLLLVHFALYVSLVAAFGIGSTALEVVFIVLAFTFVAATILTRRHSSRIADWFYTAAAYWFGLAHFLFIGGVVFYFTATILYAQNIYVAPALIGGISFGIFFLIHLYGTWGAWRAQVTRIKITLPGLPNAWKGKKAVFVSDIHLGNIYKEGFAEKVTRKINVLQPEVIFVGGDLYDGPACDVAKVAEPFRALKAPRGVYYITGNHEFYLPNVGQALETVRGLGMKILHNEKVELDGLVVAGVDFATTHKKEDYKKVMAAMNLPAGKPAILLRHEPDHLEVARDAGVALEISGHTHKGQIFPLNYITRAMYKGFDYGLKRLGDMQVFTSSGVGSWGPPLRIGTRSEVVFIEFS
ncbi:MAG TPA: metallophosphoesterase [Candidatus Paceibacterota bacterium]|jgi:hypothetical protein|nr:metallophosphoesterase [Candidatus Paceibacterota bacterium]